MNKKLMVLLGSVLIMSLGVAYSAASPQKATRNSLKNAVKSEFKPGPFFVDENGDGICDRTPRFDNGKNASGQKPDWAQRRDGSKFQNKNENNGASNHFQNRFNHREQYRWNSQTARQNRANFGNCVCDGTGQKSRSRKGNGQS